MSVGAEELLAVGSEELTGAGAERGMRIFAVGAGLLGSANLSGGGESGTNA